MSTSAVEVSGEKVKAISDKRLTEIFCDICIKEILKGNRPGTHFTKDGWLKIMTNFEKETGKAFSQRQLKIGGMPKKRMESLEELIRAKILGLGESLNQMFMGIVATGDKAWAPSSGTLRSDFFEDVNNEIPEENEEENVMSIVENSNGDESDDEREKKENFTTHGMMSKMIFTSLLRVLKTRYNLQTSRNILLVKCWEFFYTSWAPVQKFSNVEKDFKGAIDGTHIAAILPPNEQIPYIGRKDFMEYEDINWAYENIIDSENAHSRESDDDDDDESNNLSGFEMELTRDAIASSLMNSL
ncbi:hypothetical protein GOBAR_AA15802 [Gossypium barbadense]|uniref:Myb/SANT-like domain-containing protein n=1 Tax=Gossypium barbadense TaxID=3634 RepID=A0A2P5XND4_GOSBA|nr:hypothetical protein GOBAR_AA15802 [Gossypium barbadense]